MKTLTTPLSPDFPVRIEGSVSFALAPEGETPVFLPGPSRDPQNDWLYRWFEEPQEMNSTVGYGADLLMLSLDALGYARGIVVQAKVAPNWSYRSIGMDLGTAYCSRLHDRLETSGTAGTPTPHAERSAPVPNADLKRSRAANAVEDLQQWLDTTVDELADLVGASKSALHYWKRENAEPRAGLARNLYRVHALVRALKAASAPDSPTVALTRSLEGGGPSTLDLLRAGRYDEAEEALRPVIFRRHEQAVQRPRLVRWNDQEEEADSTPSERMFPLGGESANLQK